jgi:Leucine-rich repeat (LRR) protein
MQTVMQRLRYLDIESDDNLNFIKLKLERVPLVSRIIKKFPNLTEMDLSENKLTSFPKELNFLKRLELSYNLLQHNSALPVDMPELITLDLIDNKFKTFPINILNYKKLKGLDLSNNFIRTLPELPLPNTLIDLQLASNHLYFVPHNLPDSIQILNVSCNQLDSIPNPKYLPKSLKILNLSNNYISVLPDNLDQCEHLSTLTVDNNSLQVLPDNLPDKLHYLSYDDNLQSDNPNVARYDYINYYYPLLKNMSFMKKKICYINESNSKRRTFERTKQLNANLALIEKAVRFYSKPSNIERLFKHSDNTNYYDEINQIELLEVAFG